MGHVDPHIQNLVDYINQDTKFVTLSSCSGRIALFHPTATLPNRITDDSKDEDVSTTPNENSVSGKGSTGSWVFVSHDVVEDPMTTIVPFFFPVDVGGTAHTESALTGNNEGCPSDQPDEYHICYFRFEPMLLHVAACNLETGQFLLQVALQNGLRESGLIVTAQRVTVAFRTHSLALSIPMSFQKDHIFFPKSSEYVVSLTNELNRRLLLNLQLIHKVFASLQQSFLSIANPSVPTVSASNTTAISHQRTVADETSERGLVVSWEQQSHDIPILNLYGHAAVELILITDIAPYKDIDVREILVVGGYGSGPKQMQSSLSQQAKMRSTNIYRIRQKQESWGKTDVQWNSYWETVNLTTTVDMDSTTGTSTAFDRIQIFSYIADDEMHTFCTGTMQVKQIEWDGRLYTTAVNLTKILYDINNCISQSTTHVLLFGGRYGPNKPMNDLIIFEYKTHGTAATGSMFIPLDVCGSKPSPRWGHSFTALNHPRRNIDSTFDPTIIVPVAVLVGGRNTHGNCTDPLYVLSIVPTYSSSIEQSQSVENHFLWERIVTGNDTLYHHLSRCFHTATTIDDSNHIFIFGGLRCPEYLSESIDFTTTSDDHETAISLLLTVRSHNSNAGSDVNISFSADLEYVKIPNISHRFAHSAIHMISSHERHLTALGIQKGIIIIAGGVSQSKSASTFISENEGANDLFMNCLHYELTNGKVLFKEITVMGKNYGEAIDPGPLIEHCCISFPKCRTDKISSSSQYDVLFIGGGVSGFAFQDLFAPSHHFLFQWSFRSIDCFGNEGELPISYRTPPKSIVPSKTNPISMEPLESVVIHNQQLLCDVVYVLKQNAKIVKQYLEFSEFINKQYRITAIEKNGISRWTQTVPTPDGINDIQINDYIAIPIRSQCIGLVQLATQSDVEDAMSLIVGYGKQSCLASTGTYARGHGVPVL